MMIEPGSKGELWMLRIILSLYVLFLVTLELWSHR
jgi:hypothetical protein